MKNTKLFFIGQESSDMLRFTFYNKEKLSIDSFFILKGSEFAPVDFSDSHFINKRFNLIMKAR